VFSVLGCLSEHRCGTGGIRVRHEEDLSLSYQGRVLSQCVKTQYRRWQVIIAIAIPFVLLVIPFVTGAQTTVETEYRIKANFLATFPNFIEWPESAFPSAKAPFLVCVAGAFPFGTSLAEATRAVSPHGRRVEVVWIHKDQDMRSCHILFVSHFEEKKYTKILQAVQGADVLTVGETPAFLDAGGTMAFFFQQDALQFEVNLGAASEAHLRISSRLLAIAKRVTNKPEVAGL